MGIAFRWLALSLATVLISGAAGSGAANAATERHVTTFAGVYSPNRFLEILQVQQASVHLEPSASLFVLGLAQVVGHWGEHLQWEVEGQLGQHAGRQTHQEVSLVLIARWTRFPWDGFVDTRFAFGQGVSLSSQVPPLEPRTGVDEDEESQRFLNYLLVEAEFSSPSSSPWSAVVRVHHRSGVFGLYGGVDGGSNYVGVGLRRRF